MPAQSVDSLAPFFSLLRSGIYGVPVPESELPESIDWKAVVALARKHAVLGMIINAVALLPGRLRPSAATQAKMNSFALGLIQANMVLDQTAGRLAGFLAAQGIPGVLLKGQGVARYYASPQARQTGDIDFYVGKTLYRRAVGLCRSGLAAQGSDCEETATHFSFEMQGVEIELHRLASQMFSPWRRGRFQRWIEEELERSPRRRHLDLGGSPVVIPSVDFDAIFIFYHAWLHYLTGGIGLRQLCDWAVIFQTRGAELNFAELARNLRRFGLVKPWKLFACIAVDRLGVDPDRMPLFDPAYAPAARKVLNNIVAGGNFGFFADANVRMKEHGYGWRYGFAKLRAIFGSFGSLFPLAPAEAVFMLFNRLFSGSVFFCKHLDNKPFE